MDLFIEIIFRWLIVRVLGFYSRYLFFKLIGKDDAINNLTGNNEKTESTEDFYNVLVGILVFCLVSIIAAYLVFS